MTLRRPAQGFDDVPVAQLDESGAVLRVWPSRGDASEATGVHQSGIGNVIKGRAFSAGGFQWRFARGEDGVGRVATISDRAREERATSDDRAWQVLRLRASAFFVCM